MVPTFWESLETEGWQHFLYQSFTGTPKWGRNYLPVVMWITKENTMNLRKLFPTAKLTNLPLPQWDGEEWLTQGGFSGVLCIQLRTPKQPTLNVCVVQGSRGHQPCGDAAQNFHGAKGHKTSLSGGERHGKLCWTLCRWEGAVEPRAAQAAAWAGLEGSGVWGVTGLQQFPPCDPRQAHGLAAGWDVGPWHSPDLRNCIRTAAGIPAVKGERDTGKVPATATVYYEVVSLGLWISHHKVICCPRFLTVSCAFIHLGEESNHAVRLKTSKGLCVSTCLGKTNFFKNYFYFKHVALIICRYLMCLWFQSAFCSFSASWFIDL